MLTDVAAVTSDVPLVIDRINGTITTYLSRTIEVNTTLVLKSIIHSPWVVDLVFSPTLASPTPILVANQIFLVLHITIEAPSDASLAREGPTTPPTIELVALSALIDDPVQVKLSHVEPLLYNNKGVLVSDAFLHNSLAPLTNALTLGGSTFTLAINMDTSEAYNVAFKVDYTEVTLRLPRMIFNVFP